MNVFKSNLGLGVLSASRPLPKRVTAEDFILTSYPKSGNTWLRFVFANLYANSVSAGKEVNFHNIEQFSPAVGGKFNSTDHSNQKYLYPRAVKTHYNWCFRYSSHRSVLLVRHPMRCVPAFFDYLSVAQGVQYPNMTAFLSSARHGLPAWISFHQSWRKHADFILRYEDILEEPEYWIGQVVKYLNLPFTSNDIIESLERSSRSEMKKVEIKGDPYHDAGYTFVRGENEVRETAEISTVERNLITSNALPIYEELRSGPGFKLKGPL